LQSGAHRRDASHTASLCGCSAAALSPSRSSGGEAAMIARMDSHAQSDYCCSGPWWHGRVAIILGCIIPY
jgi:hypothetical protein